MHPVNSSHCRLSRPHGYVSAPRAPHHELDLTARLEQRNNWHGGAPELRATSQAPSAVSLVNLRNHLPRVEHRADSGETDEDTINNHT